VVHPSLLADYYEPTIQPRVFQIHRMASPLSATAGLLAGGMGVFFGWRATFIILAVPTFVLLAFLRNLREPHRGESVDKSLAAEVAAKADNIPFRVARRQLFSVRSLRRIWLGGFFLGIAFISIGQLLSLYFENVYGFGPWGRGMVQFLEGTGLVTGIVLGGNVASKAAARGDFPTLAKIIGGAFIWFAGGVLLMVLSPWAPVSALLVFVFGMGLGAYQPAYYPLVARVVPARVRSQAYAWALLFVGVGGILSIPLASLGESEGYRLALGILAAIVAFGGLVLFSATKTVAEDVARADASLAASAQGR
jgi:MFS family permease